MAGASSRPLSGGHARRRCPGRCLLHHARLRP
jgi:hypothetical protein